MTDGISKGTGASWQVKGPADLLTQCPNYDAYVQALAKGQLTLDLILNAAGWSVQGTQLNKTNLLKDSTAALYGKTAAAVPDDIFAAAHDLITSVQNIANGKGNIACGVYTGNGAEERLIPLPFTPEAVMVVYDGYHMYFKPSGTTYYYGGLCVKDNPLTYPHRDSATQIITNYNILSVETGGFKVYNKNFYYSANNQVNISTNLLTGGIFYYLAVA